MSDNPFSKYAQPDSGISQDNPFAKYAQPQGATTTPEPPPPPKDQTSWGMDVAKSAASGLAQGLPDAYPPVAAFDMATHAIPSIKNVAEYLGTKAANAVTGKDTQPQYVSQPPTVGEFIADKMGFDYKPKTGAGEITKVGAEIVPSLGSGVYQGGKKIVEKVAQSTPKLVTDVNAPLLETAKKFNIPVFRSQLSKSAPTKLAGSMMKDVPFSGAEGKIEDQVKAFNKAVLGTIGETGDSVTSQALGKTYDKLSANYDKLTGKYKVDVTPEVSAALRELNTKAEAELAGSPEKLAAFREYMGRVQGNTNVTREPFLGKPPEAILSGTDYQRIRSGIGKTLVSDNTSPELGELQNIIDTAFQKSMSPEDAKLFNTTREQYRNMIALEKVVRTMPQGEMLSPARLQGAVKQVFGDYAYGGDTDLEQLSRLGTLLKDTFPSSGTSQRQLVYDAVKRVGTQGLVGAASLPSVGLPIAASRYGLTPYLYKDITQSPQALDAMRRFLGPQGVESVLKQLPRQ